MTGTNFDLFTHKSSRSYLNHFVSSTPVLVAARSEARVYGRSLAGIAVSNPAGGMDACTLCVLPGRGLCDEMIIFQRSPTDCGASLCVISAPPE
jgi:hypothetical protein